MIASAVAVPLQIAGPVAIAGTIGSLALFLSLTAHLAARNVLGDVSLRNAVGVGPLPAAAAVLPEAFGVPSSLAIGLALALDLAAIRHLYGRDWRLTVYVGLVHAVVSIILGAVIVSLALLLASAPG